MTSSNLQKGLAMATFQIDSTFINEIKELITKEENSRIKRKLKPAHYADLGEIIGGYFFRRSDISHKIIGKRHYC